MTLEEAILAAENGDVLAATQAAWVLGPCARTCERAEDWEQAALYWRQYQECQGTVMLAKELTEGERMEAGRERKRGLYGQGLACLHLHRIQMGISFLAEAAKGDAAVPGNADAVALLEQLGD